MENQLHFQSKLLMILTTNIQRLNANQESLNVPLHVGDKSKPHQLGKPVVKDENEKLVAQPKVVEKTPGKFILDFTAPMKPGDYIVEVPLDGKPIATPLHVSDDPHEGHLAPIELDLKTRATCHFNHTDSRE
jgi:hypothetical protein